MPKALHGGILFYMNLEHQNQIGIKCPKTKNTGIIAVKISNLQQIPHQKYPERILNGIHYSVQFWKDSGLTS